MAMAMLLPGDEVLTLGAAGLAFTRVLVKQHVAAEHVTSVSTLLTLLHSNGTLRLTPDHVLLVNGKFAPARQVRPTDRMDTHRGASIVAAVEVGRGAVVNLITVSGTILVASGVHAGGSVHGCARGESVTPVFASVFPEWCVTPPSSHQPPSY